VRDIGRKGKGKSTNHQVGTEKKKFSGAVPDKGREGEIDIEETEEAMRANKDLSPLCTSKGGWVPG